MRHQNGSVLEVLQRTFPIGLDANGYMVRYLNTFHVLGGYEVPESRFSPLQFQLMDQNNNRLTDVEKVALERSKVHFPNPFSERQTQILKHIADAGYAANLSLIAKKMDIRRDTLYEYVNKGGNSIMAKAEKQCERRFKDHTQVARYYRGLAII